MTNRFDQELSLLGTSYEIALTTDINSLLKSFEEVVNNDLVAIGSGGSFTAAWFLTDIHERTTSNLGRALTPLEYISNPAISDGKSLFLISAEGNNTDIIEALRLTRNSNVTSLHVITNTQTSNLTKLAKSLDAVQIHSFPLPSRKDGYLATNTLLATTTIFARVYMALAKPHSQYFPPKLTEFEINRTQFNHWTHDITQVYQSLFEYPTISVIYDPELKVAGIDFESKLIEAGLANVQTADIRNFAHGRHFWLARHSDTTSVLALIGDRCIALWKTLLNVFPDTIEVREIIVSGHFPNNAISSLTAVMHLAGLIGNVQKLDLGKPEVPNFGRRIFHMPIRNLIRPGVIQSYNPIQLKQKELGQPWHNYKPTDAQLSALKAFRSDLISRRFAAVVFDYDGTLCHTQHRYDPPQSEVIEHLVNLANCGVRIGLASGRGESLHKQLQSSIRQSIQKQFTLGLHNGGHIVELDQNYQHPIENNDSLLLAARNILYELRKDGAPINNISIRPHQISISIEAGVDSERVWFVVASAFRRASIPTKHIVRSGHSIDILGSYVSKLNVLKHLREVVGISEKQILTIGDQGAWPGNDYELLERKHSLSVDIPSRSLDSGWNLAPSPLKGVDATLWYLERFIPQDDRTFCVNLEQPPSKLPANALK